MTIPWAEFFRVGGNDTADFMLVIEYGFGTLDRQRTRPGRDSHPARNVKLSLTH